MKTIIKVKGGVSIREARNSGRMQTFRNLTRLGYLVIDVDRYHVTKKGREELNLWGGGR